MPHHKSAKKRLKTNERARQRNAGIKSALRKKLKEHAALSGEEARASIPSTCAFIDRTARKGVIPKQRADRMKSRLTRRTQRGSAG